MNLSVFFGVVLLALSGVRADSEIQSSFSDVGTSASATESGDFLTGMTDEVIEASVDIEPTAMAEMTSSTPAVTTPEDTSDFQRTVILIHKETTFGQNLFIRGGITHGQREGCGDMEDLADDPCSIPIINRVLDINGTVDARDAWAQGDVHMDWYGAEENQGNYSGIEAQGTPAQWTTNDDNNEYYSSLNSIGPHYWLVDVDMDCSKTEDGFFEFKAILNDEWEPTNSKLDVRCFGDEARDVPYEGGNHFGLCGFINVYEWGEGICEIADFE